MSDLNLKDDDIGDLFAAAPVYDDSEVFQARVMRGLRFNLWLRQGVVVLAGFVGGLYALAQFIHMPNWAGGEGGSAPKVATVTLTKAATETDETLRAGVEFFDGMGKSAMSLIESSARYLNLMQTPFFFWVSFSLCLACLALYYAYSQEETI
ncbi:hypothetical protein ABENE_02485 [Asticcacaulis benevestitus DSM 16100 = ATCC BAA-896]|uniref:Uncharacterized protein n=1 Tax=Asticcacaulis benevestitus DSM 16100 = ATCC BAA-896 TaxID=1121022 RepID=V4RT95_9CAUL|nr:hypothetical protein ABENE_02485 [Asticcacaulis benevestitus DSM 16100 = ATCC BAA-896]